MEQLCEMFACAGAVDEQHLAWVTRVSDSSGPEILSQVVQTLLLSASGAAVDEQALQDIKFGENVLPDTVKMSVAQGIVLGWGLVSEASAGSDGLASVSKVAVQLCQAICPSFMLSALPEDLLRLARVKGAPDKKALLRTGTSRFYKQSKFNLMAECSEGYAKVFLEMHMQHTGTAHTIGRIQALCGRFQLDGNRLLEMALGAAEARMADIVAQESAAPHAGFMGSALQGAAFFGGLQRFRGVVQQLGDMCALFQRGALPHVLGARMKAHLLHSSLDSSPSLLSRGTEGGSVPAACAVLCVLLVQHGLLQLEQLLPHLSSAQLTNHTSKRLIQQIEAACESYSVATLSAASGVVGAGAADVPSPLQLTPSQAVNGAIAGMSPTAAYGSLAGSGITSVAFAAFCGSKQASASLDSTLRAAQRSMSPLVGVASAAFSLAAAAIRVTANDAAIPDGVTQSSSGESSEDYSLSVPGSATELLQIGTDLLQVFFADGGCHVSLCPPLTSALLQIVDALLQQHSKLRITAALTLTELAPVLVLLGPALASDPRLFAQLLDLLRTAQLSGSLPQLRQANPASEQARIKPEHSFVHAALQQVFLPALVCCGNNKYLCAKLWNVLGCLPWSVRYSLYSSLQQTTYTGGELPGAWGLGGTSTLAPSLLAVGEGCSLLPKLAGLRAEHFTRQALKRVAADTVRRAGQQFGKTAAGNALVLFSTLLTQLSQYDNLIAMVAEQSLGSLTPMAIDQGMFCITQHLSIQRPYLQADGVTIRSWLSALSSFVGAFLTKFPSADVAGFLFACQRQLLQKQLQPIWPLQAMLQAAVGVNIMTDIADSLVDALAGSARLVHVLGMFKARQTASADLRSLHTAFGLAADSFAASPLSLLTVLVQQLATDTIYGENSATLPLKVVGTRFDKVGQLGQQLLEYSRLHATSAASLEARLPPFSELFSQFSLSAPAAWALLRPLIRSVTYPHGIRTLTVEASADASDVDGTVEVAADPSAVESVDDALSVWGAESARQCVGGDWTHALHIFASRGLVAFVQEHLKPTLPPLQLTGANRHVQEAVDESLWQSLSPALYSLFWAHEPCDLCCPSSAYRDALATSSTSSRAVEEELQHDLSLHRAHARKVQQAFRLHDHLLVPRNTRNRVWYFFTQVCTLPRATLSAADALYAARFLHTLHLMDTHNLSSLRMFNQTLLCVTPVLSSCTENEAVHLGIFLRELLSPIMALTRGSTFEAERIRRKGWRKGFKGSEPIDKEQFFSVLGAWDERLGAVFRSMLETGEHSHVKNSILVLRRLHGLFPFAQSEATKVLKCVAQVRDNDARQDLQTLARGYHGMLSQRAVGLPLTMRLVDQTAPSEVTEQAQQARAQDPDRHRHDRSSSRPPPPSRPPSGRSPSSGRSGLSVKRARHGSSHHSHEPRQVSRRSEGRTAPSSNSRR